MKVKRQSIQVMREIFKFRDVYNSATLQRRKMESKGENVLMLFKKAWRSDI